jgi:cobalt/nickel transport system ATP-binding protein
VSGPVLDLCELAFSWPGGTRALDQVSFSVKEGETLALVGPNGAGKSTLLLLLVGLLRPETGEIRAFGEKLDPRRLPALRQRIGLLLQDPDDQLFLPTVLDDVAFGPRNLGLDRDEARNQAIAALEVTGVAHLRDRPHHRLSAGEKRLVALASVLALRPEVLLVDEPSSHLDPRARRNLIGLFRGLRTTLVMVTHDLDLAWDLCTRTVVLFGGKVAADGPSERLLADAELMTRCGLELPLCLQERTQNVGSRPD